MNLWFRLLWLWLTAWRRAPLTSPLEASTIYLRVMPNDLDVFFHVNNGRYLTLMDLGRLDMFLRSGLMKATRRRGWSPVLSAASVRFRRELRVWNKFRIETQLLHWSGATFVMQHRLYSRSADGGELLNTQALMRAGVYDRRARRFVEVAELMAEMDVDIASPPMSEAVRTFLEAEVAQKATA